MVCNTETTPEEGEIDSEKIFLSLPRVAGRRSRIAAVK
jgi:hypothetical protein